MKRIGWLSLSVAMLAVAFACGGGNKNNPSGTGGSGSCSVTVSVLGCPKGLIRATIDGQPANFGVTNGASLYTPIAAVPALGIPAQDFITFAGTASNNSQMVFGVRAKTGQQAIGLNVINPETNNVSVNIIQLVLPATGGGTVGSGWATSAAGGSGTVTLDSVSTSGAAGSFSITMLATPGTPATGTRSVSGTFSVTF